MNKKKFLTAALFALTLMFGGGCGTPGQVNKPNNMANQKTTQESNTNTGPTRKIDITLNYEKEELENTGTLETDIAPLAVNPEIGLPIGEALNTGFENLDPSVALGQNEYLYDLIRQTYDYRAFPTRFQDDGPFLYSHDIKYENLPWVEDDDYYGPPINFRYH